MGDIKCTTSAFNIERSAPVPRIKEEVHADVNDTLKTCPPDIQKAGHTWIAACYHQRPVSVSRGNLSIQNNNHEAEFSVDGRLFHGNSTKAIMGWSHAASRAKLRKVQRELSWCTFVYQSWPNKTKCHLHSFVVCCWQVREQQNLVHSALIPECLKHCCWVSRGAWKCYREAWWFALPAIMLPTAAMKERH